jgi:hypothetical protein
VQRGEEIRIGIRGWPNANCWTTEALVPAARLYIAGNSRDAAAERAMRAKKHTRDRQREREREREREIWQ